MITFESRAALARHAAAQFATDLLMTRCRTGAEQALMPQNRWFAANTQGLHDWLREGGFQSEIQPKQKESKAAAAESIDVPRIDVAPIVPRTASNNESSGRSRCFPVPPKDQ